jgi:hypothetical protein
MHRERSGVENAFVCIMLQERKLAHPNIVLVHDRSHESSLIDLLESWYGGVFDPSHPDFFSGWITFPNLRLVGLELGGKKFDEKKSPEASCAKEPDLRASAIRPTLFDFDRTDD